MGSDFRVQVSHPSVLLKLFLVAAVFPFAMYLADVYESRSEENLRGLFVRLMQSLGVTALAFAAIYAILPGLIVGRGVFVLAVGFILGLVPLWRTAFDQVVTHFAPGERILFIGPSRPPSRSRASCARASANSASRSWASWTPSVRAFVTRGSSVNSPTSPRSSIATGWTASSSASKTPAARCRWQNSWT